MGGGLVHLYKAILPHKTGEAWVRALKTVSPWEMWLICSQILYLQSAAARFCIRISPLLTRRYACATFGISLQRGRLTSHVHLSDGPEA